MLLWYEIDQVLGRGGFGITYLAHHKNLQRPVAIKEYLPGDLAERDTDSTVRSFPGEKAEYFERFLKAFQKEGQTLNRIKHPNIVRVQDLFEANGTAYMVMEYEKGEDLATLLRRRKTISEPELFGILLPLLDGLEKVHDAGIIHRDIKPANIFLRKDGDPVLLDFGSARMALGTETRTLTAMVSQGFSPFEQYHGEKQGPWTDIYALGALTYQCISAERPVDALIRGKALLEGAPDPLCPALKAGEGRYTRELLAAVDCALNFRVPDRPHTVSAWRSMLLGEATAGTSSLDGQGKPMVTAESAPTELAEVEPEGPAFGKAPRERMPAATLAGRRWIRTAALLAAAAVVVSVGLYQGASRWLTPTGETALSAKMSKENRASVTPSPVPVTGVVPDHRTYALAVKTEPPEAKVRFLDLEAAYSTGMQLKPGRYHFEVTATGYETKDQWVVVDDQDQEVAVSLYALRYALTVKTDPPEARVQLLNVEAAYRPGMQLKPGRYHFEVTAPGYESKHQWVAVEDRDLEVAVSLDALRYAFTVKTDPPEARVRLLNIEAAYSPEMQLRPGRYHYEVTAPGYETKRQWVAVEDRGREVAVSLKDMSDLRTVKTMPPRAKLVVGSEELLRKIDIRNPQFRSLGRLTQAQVMVRNATEANYTLEYKFDWEDGQGFNVDSINTWHRFTLTPLETKTFTSTGKAPDATNIVFTVRLPNDIFNGSRQKKYERDVSADDGLIGKE